MIFLRKCFFSTTVDVDVLSLIHDVRFALRDAHLPAGLITVVIPEPGASLLIFEPLPEIVRKMKELLPAWINVEGEALSKRKEPIAIAPWMRGAMLGRTLSVPFHEGSLLLGPREEIMLVDFEEVVRRRAVVIQVMGDEGKKTA